jgi:serine/threonine protein kinase/Tfp pilus assembly protein PilF
VCPDDGGILIAAKKDPAVGTVIEGKYEILETLGGGGMGVVYRAKHLLMHRIVAVKMLLPETVSNEYALARFQKEAQAASQLNHPNILTVFDFGIAEKTKPYLVMDYLKGQSLAQILDAEGYIHLQRALSIFIQIASALAHAHQQGVIHRDLKPANVMLVEFEGQGDFVKIVDFGIAKLLPKGDGQSIELTQTGQVFGSPLYMSPEQCHGKSLDARSDIYSLGCVMFRTVTGKSPFLGQDALELMYKHVNDAPPTFAQCCPDLKLPKNFEDVVRKCLEKEVDRRYESMIELRKDLEAVAGYSVNSPFIFPVGEEHATKTPKIGELNDQRTTLNEMMKVVEAAKARKEKTDEPAPETEVTANTAQAIPAQALQEGSANQAAAVHSDAGVADEAKAFATSSGTGSASTSGNGARSPSATSNASNFNGANETSAGAVSPPKSHGIESTGAQRLRANDLRLIATLAALVIVPVAAIIFKSVSEHQSTKAPQTDTTAPPTTTNPSTADLVKSGREAYEKGDYVNAAEQLKKVLALSVLNKDFDAQYESHVLLGKISLAEWQYDAAKGDFYAVASAANSKENRPSDAQLATAWNGLGEILTSQGDFAKAEDDFEKALALRKKMDPKTARVAQTLTGLGNLQLYQKQYQKALKNLTDAEKLSVQINGGNDAETAKILNDKGQAYQLLKKLPEAEACYKKALDIRQKVLNHKDPAIASSKMCLGALAFNKRDYTTAESLIKDALTIATAAFGQENAVVAQNYFMLGVLYETQKKYQLAADNYQQAYDIRTKLMPARDSTLQHTKDLLQKCKKKLGKG